MKSTAFVAAVVAALTLLLSAGCMSDYGASQNHAVGRYGGAGGGGSGGGGGGGGGY